jgi:hypothetical protein
LEKNKDWSDGVLEWWKRMEWWSAGLQSVKPTAWRVYWIGRKEKELENWSDRVSER